MDFRTLHPVTAGSSMMPSSTRLRYLAAVGIVDLVIMSSRCADVIKGMDFVWVVVSNIFYFHPH